MFAQAGAVPAQGSSMEEVKKMEKAFTFTSPDAVEIAYIMQRNQESTVFLHKLLVWAENLEDLYCPKPSHPKD